MCVLVYLFNAYLFRYCITIIYVLFRPWWLSWSWQVLSSCVLFLARCSSFTLFLVRNYLSTLASNCFFFLFRRMNECQCIAYTCFHFTPVRISYFQIFCVERECETELIQMYLFQLSPTFRGICAFHFHSNLYSFMKLSTNIICSLKLMFQWNNRIWC